MLKIFFLILPVVFDKKIFKVFPEHLNINLEANIIFLSRPTGIYEPRHEISNNVVCATSKASDQPAHTRSLIRVFACRLTILLLLSYRPNIIWNF